MAQPRIVEQGCDKLLKFIFYITVAGCIARIGRWISLSEAGTSCRQSDSKVFIRSKWESGQTI